jgi:hypothetical protein
VFAGFVERVVRVDDEDLRPLTAAKYLAHIGADLASPAFFAALGVALLAAWALIEKRKRG